MNHTKIVESIRGGESEETPATVNDVSMKRHLVKSTGESNVTAEITQNQESQTSGMKVTPKESYTTAGIPSDHDHSETDRWQQQLQQQQLADSQRSLVAVALAEERDRKMAAVSTTLARASSARNASTTGSTNTTGSTINMISSSSSPPNPHLHGSRIPFGIDDHPPRVRDYVTPIPPPSLHDSDRFANVRLQQQMLLYQQQQQQQQQLILNPTLSSMQHPQVPGLMDHYNYQNNLQQQLAIQERLQRQASAIHLQQQQQRSFNSTGNYSTGMMNHLQLENVDAQFRQRQLMELAVLQNHQRNLWMTLNNDRVNIIPSVPYQNAPQFSTNDAGANLSTHVTTTSSHLNNEISPQDNATIDSVLKNHLQTAKTTTVRQQKRKQLPVDQGVKASKSKSSKVDANAKLEYNFEPENMKELSLPTDSENLSEYQCLLRQQIILFTVGSADIECSAQGRNKPIVLGQVGTLCRYCAKLKPGLRPSGAVYFPAKLSGLYQASQNMAINHFSNNCQSIPEPIRQRLLKLKEQKSTVLGGGKHFWANCARVIGVVEHDDQLRFTNKSTDDTVEGTEKIACAQNEERDLIL